MPKKKSKTQEYLEAKVIHKMNGVIDLEKLWKAEEDKELDPKVIERLAIQDTVSHTDS
jgi:hypothetical protein